LQVRCIINKACIGFLESQCGFLKFCILNQVEFIKINHIAKPINVCDNGQATHNF